MFSRDIYVVLKKNGSEFQSLIVQLLFWIKMLSCISSRLLKIYLTENSPISISLPLFNERKHAAVYITWRNTNRHLFPFAFSFSSWLRPPCWISPACTRLSSIHFRQKTLRFCSPPKKSAACAITLLTTLPFDLRPRREGRGGREFQAPRHLSLCPVSPRACGAN